MEYEINKVGFLQSSMPKQDNKANKVRPKRRHVKDGVRVMVGTRLTTEQVAKLDTLVDHYTEVTGVQATRASVIAELIDNTKGD